MPITTEQHAMQRVRSLAGDLTKQLGWTHPLPYSQSRDQIGRLLDLRIEEGPLPPGHLGMYTPKDPPERCVVRVSPGNNQDPDRLNFSFYHEVFHHLIRRDDELYAFLSDHAARDRDLRSATDAFCNAGAAEMLLPTE